MLLRFRDSLITYSESKKAINKKKKQKKKKKKKLEIELFYHII